MYSSIIRRLIITLLAGFCLCAVAGPPSVPPTAPSASQAASPTTEDDSFTYVIIPKTVELNVAVGPISRAVNYTYHFGSLVPKYLLMFGLHPPSIGALATWSAFELSHISASMAVYNLTDLKIRQTLATRKLMQELRKIPHIQQVYLVSGGPFQWNGIMAESRKIQNLVILKTAHPLPEVTSDQTHPGLDPNWGTPISVPDPKKAVFLIRLSIGGKRQPKVWRVTLDEILNHAMLPDKIQQGWRKSIEEANKKVPGWWNKSLHHLIFRPLPEPPADHIRLDAEVSVPGRKGKMQLNAIAIGSEVEKILGASYWAKFLASLHLNKVGTLPLSQRRFQEATKPLYCGQAFETLALTR